MRTPLEEKALDALQKYSLLQPGDRIAVGVSGGADSVALLRFLAQYQEQNRWEITVCHVNHGLRGAEADRDEQFVRALAERLRLPCLVRRCDAAALAAAQHCSVEEAGRRVRYSFFAEAAGESGRIATAHTLQDSIETVLLNMIRGTGLHGLCGIPRIRGNIIRPLLDCTRAEVEQYLAALGQPYCTDSTNRADDYTRNAVRHRILPQMQALNPNFDAAMARMTAQLTAQWSLTEELAAQAAQQLQGAACGGALDRQGLLALPEPVADRLLLRLLEEQGLPVSAAVLGRMRQTARTGGRLEVAGRCWYFVAAGETVRLLYCPPQGIGPLPLSLPPAEKSVVFRFGAQKRIKLTLCNKIVANQSEKFNISLLKNAVDCDKIIGNSVLRTRRPGDAMAVGKTARPLGELWGAAGLPALLRPSLAVIADEQGPVWAETVGRAARVAVTPGTKQFVIIECMEENEYENGQGHLQGNV